MTLLLDRDFRCPQSMELLARHVMAINPKSIDQHTSVHDIEGIFAAYGIHIAPVVDEAGRPIGVISRADLDNYRSRHRDGLLGVVSRASIPGASNATPNGRDFDVTARHMMAPVVVSVPDDAPIASIIEKILELEIRCLYVIDVNGVLVGVIRVFDLLRKVAEYEQLVR